MNGRSGKVVCENRRESRWYACMCRGGVMCRVLELFSTIEFRQTVMPSRGIIELKLSNKKNNYFITLYSTECVTDLDLWSKMIIFGWILTPFEPNIIFACSWGSIKNWLEHRIKPPSGNLACPNPWNTLYQLLYILIFFSWSS